MSASAIQQVARRQSPAALESERRCFTVVDGNETFGLPVESVQTIFRVEGVTPVPLGPAEVEGLVNLRGRIVTAVSLKRRLTKAALDSARGNLAIGIEHDGENFALIVDDVGDVITCDESAEIARPPHVDAARARLTSAYYRLDEAILPILDMKAIFDFAECHRSSGSAHPSTADPRSDQ